MEFPGKVGRSEDLVGKEGLAAGAEPESGGICQLDLRPRDASRATVRVRFGVSSSPTSHKILKMAKIHPLLLPGKKKVGIGMARDGMGRYLPLVLINSTLISGAAERRRCFAVLRARR